MPRALSFLAGAAQGVGGAVAGERERRRQAMMDALEERKVRQLELSGESERGLGERAQVESERAGAGTRAYQTGQLGLGQGQLELGRDELGLKRSQFLDETREITPGGFTATIGGKQVNFPGRLDILQRLVPLYSQQGQDASAMGRLRTELDFRKNNPDLYRVPGQRNMPRTPEEAKQQLLIDIMGNPYLGEQPGARARMFDEALGLGQRHMPNLYGMPPESPTDVFMRGAQSDPATSTREGAEALLRKTLTENPQVYDQLDQTVIMDWLERLPSAPRPKPQVVDRPGPFRKLLD